MVPNRAKHHMTGISKNLVPINIKYAIFDSVILQASKNRKILITIARNTVFQHIIDNRNMSQNASSKFKFQLARGPK